MKSSLLAAVLILVASAKLNATEALIFDGGGHNLYILVGSDDRGPAIAEVRYTPPGAKDWIPVPREQLKIEKFDMDQRILIMRFPKQTDPESAPPFSLSVKKNRAVLTIKGKKFRSSFNWFEE